MHMIRHQHVSMDRATNTYAEFFQLAQITDIIDLLEEARLTVVTTLDHMFRNTGQIDPKPTA
ncbi:hypothetical protein A7A76_24580 [Lysobacter enzymogenes]|nr:hypothetical protein [Lysobacter enzymogenes]